MREDDAVVVAASFVGMLVVIGVVVLVGIVLEWRGEWKGKDR